MYKKILICLLIIIAITGCSYNKKVSKITLDNKYYNEGKYIEVKSSDIKGLNDNNYILYAHNTFCAFKVPCDTIFKKYMTKYKIDFLSINIDEYKKTKFYKSVKYVPTVIIVEKGEIKAYLDAESDDDLNRYQDSKEFEKWINKYVSKNVNT